jgi:hypothetical protein
MYGPPIYILKIKACNFDVNDSRIRSSRIHSEPFDLNDLVSDGGLIDIFDSPDSILENLKERWTY